MSPEYEQRVKLAYGDCSQLCENIIKTVGPEGRPQANGSTRDITCEISDHRALVLPNLTNSLYR